jgi:DNA-directed RNA polymerase specialized sigma24 family protein
LKKLPPALQRVVIIRSQVWKQEEVAEVTGIRSGQVEPLLRAAAVQLAELNENRHDRERPVALPRGAAA